MMMADAPAPVRFLDVDFAPLDETGALAWVNNALAASQFRYLVTPNVDHLVRLHRSTHAPWHPAFADALAHADCRINDSRVLARLARQSGFYLPAVPGSDLTRALIERGLPKGTKVALIGGRHQEADWLRAHLPGCTILQCEPPMGVLSNPAAQAMIVAFVEEHRPALSLFAIGAPQSEVVCRQIQARGMAPGVGLCIGASVEFLSGAQTRAPKLWQRLGVEWAYRLLSEPRRMWRRYLVEAPKIFAIWHRWQRSVRS